MRAGGDLLDRLAQGTGGPLIAKFPSSQTLLPLSRACTTARPKRSLSFSAWLSVSRSPMLRSFVRCAPPTGTTPVMKGTPSR